MSYGTIRVVDGPCRFSRVPTIGLPLWGYCLTLNYTRTRFCRTVTRTAVYKVTRAAGLEAEATYVGTLR